MRTTSFREIFDRVVQLHGRDPLGSITADLRSALVGHINERVRIICKGWRWPEWELTEERAFRQVWHATHQYSKISVNGRPDEVFYIPTGLYYRVKSSAPANPPIGTLPTNTTYFEQLVSVDSFIDYNQTCKRAIGFVRGIYGVNPRIPTGSNNGLLNYRPSEKGVDVMGSCGPTVFVTYSMPVPKFTMTPYAVGKAYSKGAVIFDPFTGECFQALVITSDVPSNTAFWRWVPFLETWEPYVTKGSFADSLLEFDQGGNTEVQAKVALAQAADLKASDMLQLEVDALATQGQKLQWNFCKRTGYCETQPWGGGEVSELTDVCEDELGWVYPTPPPTATLGWEYHAEIVAILTATNTPALQELITTNRTIGSLVVIAIGGPPELQTWRLDAGTANPLDPGQVQPGDWNIVTNNKHWTKVI